MRTEGESVLTEHRMTATETYYLFSQGTITKKEVQLYKELVRMSTGDYDCLQLLKIKEYKFKED